MICNVAGSLDSKIRSLKSLKRVVTCISRDLLKLTGVLGGFAAGVFTTVRWDVADDILGPLPNMSDDTLLDAL